MACGLPVRMFTAGEFIFATRKRPDRYTATFFPSDQKVPF